VKINSQIHVIAYVNLTTREIETSNFYQFFPYDIRKCNVDLFPLYRMAAKNILQVAERVEKALSETQDIQKTVNDGIFVTSQNIVDANNSLTKVCV
jgi:hypothetical protein